ncbi:MAG TPA: hypothetical protein DC057_16035 [Spirochaetia bacterium]|nr:hypothetical protein [Spirochaetia bacterium]
MKNIFVFLTLFSVCMYLSPESKILSVLNKMSTGQNVTIVCYGDSITWGYETFFVQSKNNYPVILEKELQKKYNNQTISVINKGKNSMTSKWGSDNLQSLVIDEKPDLVIVSFGINDVIYLNSISNFQKNMLTIYNELEKNEIANLFLTPTPVLGGYKRGVKEYSNKITESYIQNNIQFLNLYDNFDSILNSTTMPLKVLPDFIHPVYSYSEIADQIITYFSTF